MRCCLLLVAGLAVFAGAPAARALSLDASFASERERETELPATGYTAALAQSLGDYFFADVNFSQLRTEPFTDGGIDGREEYLAGGADLGVGFALSERIALSLAAGYVRSEVRGLDGFAGDEVIRTDGPAGSLNLSVQLHRWVDFFLGPSYSYVGREPAWQGNAGMSFKLLKGVWLNVGYWGGPTKDGWNAGLRFGE